MSDVHLYLCIICFLWMPYKPIAYFREVKDFCCPELHFNNFSSNIFPEYVYMDDFWFPMICPQDQYKFVVFNCTIGHCHCTNALTVYRRCFNDMEFCDEIHSWGECSFTYSCHNMLQENCPEHDFPDMHARLTSEKKSTPIIVFFVGIFCILLATSGIFLFKRRRRRSKNITVEHADTSFKMKQLFKIKQ